MTSVSASLPSGTPQNARSLRELAGKIETQFLEEMLKTAGLGRPREVFGGGIGEDQFSSFLIREYAAATVAAGGFGLSEAIFQALTQGDRTDEHDR